MIQQKATVSFYVKIQAADDNNEIQSCYIFALDRW